MSIELNGNSISFILENMAKTTNWNCINQTGCRGWRTFAWSCRKYGQSRISVKNKHFIFYTHATVYGRSQSLPDDCYRRNKLYSNILGVSHYYWNYWNQRNSWQTWPHCECKRCHYIRGCTYCNTIWSDKYSHISFIYFSNKKILFTEFPKKTGTIY